MSFGIFQFRRGTAAQWSASNPVLADGEFALETDTRQFKLGDGTTPWNSLAYGGIIGPAGPQGNIGPQGNDGWEPVLAVVTDGERRVLRLVDWIGGGGTKPAVPTNNYLGPTGFTNLAGATDIRGATGPTGPASGVTSFNGRTGSVMPQQADYDQFFTTDAEAVDIAIAAVDGHTSAPDPHPQYTTDAEATSIANGAVSTHTSAPDPHPQYTTASEAAAAAPVQSVFGRAGAITAQQADYDAFFLTPAEGDARYPQIAHRVTNTARSASFSTAVTTVGSLPVTGGSIVAGAQYRISAAVLVTNTTTATNLVATVAVGATAVATLTQALGTTARTAQTILIQGSITFSSATAADGHVRAFASAAAAFDAVAGTGAAQATVATAANTDINLKLNTSGATSTLIVKELTIEKVK